MKTWFTADDHFGHENIIKYCNRPFKDVNHMDETLIENWNTRVKKDDIVFINGDLCFRNSPGGKKGEGTTKKPTHYISLLNGHKVFIKGNHDRNNLLKTIIEKVIISYGGKRICLVHNPIHTDNNYEINFVAHVHEKWKFKTNHIYHEKIVIKQSYMINIGVDVWNFRPISFEEIMKDFRKWRRFNV